MTTREHKPRLVFPALLFGVLWLRINNDSVRSRQEAYWPSASMQRTRNIIRISSGSGALIMHKPEHDIPEVWQAPTNYTWIGNHFYSPPSTAPLSAPTLRDLYQSENTLWYGDSTGRQDYHTLHQMLNAPARIEDVPTVVLEQNINKGKGGDAIKYCPTTHATLKDEGHTFGPTCNTTATIGKLDFIPSACYKQVIADLLLPNMTALLRRYSVVVFSLGVWEVARAWDCRSANATETANFVLTHLLEDLNAVSSSQLFIIWKTHGSSATEEDNQQQRNSTLKLAQTATDWFQRRKPPFMGLADFNTAMHPRLFGKHRISGDLKPHFGVEARLLSIDMVSQLVLMSRKTRQVEPSQ